MKLKTSHSDRSHSKLSPSAADRWVACPGSVELSKHAPEPKPSKYAREGTEAHECLEFIVRGYDDRRQAMKDAFKRWPDTMVRHALTAADLIHSSRLKPKDGGELLVEQRVVLKSAADVYGTLDYAWVDPWGDLVVIDYKYGAGHVVFPSDEDGNLNPQLGIYAAAIAAKYDYEFERVKIAIIQPRVYGSDEEPIATVVVSPKALKKFERSIAAAAQKALSKGAPLNAGDHCRWCPALATCPENSKKALALAEVEFDFEETPRIEALPSVQLIDVKTISNVLKAGEKLELWLNAVRERAKLLAEDGVKIPGYKLVAKRAQRTWLPEAEAKAAGLWQLQAYKLHKTFLSPAQLRKEIGEEAEAFISRYSVALSSGSNLVREDDKRSEIVPTSVFDYEDSAGDEWSW